MSIASQDVTGDGMPEVFLSSMGDNKLQSLDDGSSGPAYSDVALAAGVTATQPYVGDTDLPSTAWHADFQDVNNDGFVDLYIAKGNVDAMPDAAANDPNNLLLGGPAGTFSEAGMEAGIAGFASTRGAAVVDLNLDGMLDLVEVNREAQVAVWRNIGWGLSDEPRSMGNWLALRLRQPAPNVDAVGAWIEVRVGDQVMADEVTIGGGHAGGQLTWIHVGLGRSDEAELRVHWPDGRQSSWFDVGANQFLLVDRATAAASRRLVPDRAIWEESEEVVGKRCECRQPGE